MKERGKQKKSNEFKGTFLVFITALISGISIVANKAFVEKMDPLIFTATRALLIGIAFFIISFYIAKKQKTKFKQSSWKYLISIGIIGGGFAFWLFFTGLKLTMAGRAAFIHKTLPIYALILAFIFLKEKITKQQLWALGIMIFGLILMQLPKLTQEIRTGDFLVLGATILWAIENTISKKAMNKNENNFVVTFSRMFFGGLLLIAIIALTGKFNLLLELTGKQIIYLLMSTLFLFTYVLSWYWGLKFINLSKAATILLVAPVISLILGTIFLGEEIIMLSIVGSLVILIGAYLITKTKSEKRIIEV